MCNVSSMLLSRCMVDILSCVTLMCGCARPHLHCTYFLDNNRALHYCYTHTHTASHKSSARLRRVKTTVACNTSSCDIIADLHACCISSARMTASEMHIN